MYIPITHHSPRSVSSGSIRCSSSPIPACNWVIHPWKQKWLHCPMAKIKSCPWFLNWWGSHCSLTLLLCITFHVLSAKQSQCCELALQVSKTHIWYFYRSVGARYLNKVFLGILEAGFSSGTGQRDQEQEKLQSPLQFIFSHTSHSLCFPL